MIRPFCQNIFTYLSLEILHPAWILGLGLWTFTMPDSRGNMASPLRPGSLSGVPLASLDLGISHQKIIVRLAPDLRTARFSIDYYIGSDKPVTSLPLVFYAVRLTDSLQVQLNGRRVPLRPFPPDSLIPIPMQFLKGIPGLDSGYVRLNLDQDGREIIPFEALRYFEVNLDPGTHHIHVEYTSSVWEDRSDWVKRYSFFYSLEPARYWKSFGSLEVEVSQIGAPLPLYYSLGPPHRQPAPVVAQWSFTRLPADVLEIRYQPPLPRVAGWLIKISPSGLAVGVFFLLAISHAAAIIRRRRHSVSRRISGVAIIGSLLVPLAGLLTYAASFYLIDHLIGPHASARHQGYPFLSLLLYPILLPVYGGVMLILDYWKGKEKRN